MNVEVVDTDLLARHAAQRVAARLRELVADRGRASLALSGGSTPAAMLEVLAELDVPWPQIDVLQVDERVVPATDERRNLAMIRAALLDRLPDTGPRLHAVPVDDHLDVPADGSLGDAVVSEQQAQAVAAAYERMVVDALGRDPVIDLVLLGLGDDGHTASLFPDDPALEVVDRPVAASGVQQGTRRVTLTRPTLSRAAQRWYLVAGEGKAGPVATLVQGDATSIPPGRLPRTHSVLLLDPPAASRLDLATG